YRALCRLYSRTNARATHKKSRKRHGRTRLWLSSFADFCHGIVFPALAAYFPGQIRPRKLNSIPAAHTSHLRADFAVHGLNSSSSLTVSAKAKLPTAIASDQ